MFTIIIYKINNSSKIFSLISNHNFKITILDIIAQKKNLNYISKFRLLANITYHINLYLIFSNIYINNPTIILNVKLNSWIFNYFKSY